MGFSLIKPGVLFAGLFVCGWPPGQFTTGTNPHSPRTQKKKPSSPRLLPSPSPSLLSVHSSLPLLAHTPGGPPGISAIKCKEGNNSITKGGLHTQGRRHLLLGGIGGEILQTGEGPRWMEWAQSRPGERIICHWPVGALHVRFPLLKLQVTEVVTLTQVTIFFFLKKLTSAISYKQVEPHFQHVSVKVSRKTQIYISCVMMNNWATIGC